jgi:uncharacterized protein YjbJ (UPF0337 family)
MAGTRMKWEGRWDQLKGKAKKIWADLTDDELGQVEGDYDKTVGVIKERSGETIESIEDKLDRAWDDDKREI